MAVKTSKRAYLEQLDKMTVSMRRLFLKWVGERVSAANVGEIERSVSAGEISIILLSLGVAEASLSTFVESIRETYKAGGALESKAAHVTFNVRNPDAEAWVRNRSSQLIVEIVDSQREAIQVVMQTGMRNGTNPRTTALDIVGRKNATGRRAGGIVGLTGQQAEYVTRAEAQLRSGDPAELKKYLTRKLRDKRFDSVVRRAITTGKPIPVAQAKKMSGLYADRLLKLRGETIARTESTGAMNAARDQAWQQSIEEGNVLPQFITSVWSATGDARTRHSHSVMNGQTREYGVPFNSPTGAQMMYPGDTSLGAQAEDIANCRCFLQRQADFIAEAAFLSAGGRAA